MQEKKDNIIELRHITRRFEDGFEAVSDFNLEVKRGEFVTFLGPSGCGKTTTLRMIAGFDLPTDGQILLEGRDITSLPPYERPINTVFQRYALFPHMNIYENIAFGLRQKKMKEAEIKRKVEKVLDLVDLEGFEGRAVTTLSGGQQQRIAIARALVNEPAILLLDEPALTMSDRIVVMSEGKTQQIGTPEDIYNEPKNAFVADFIGESNIFNGIMTGKMKARFCGGEFTCVDDVEEGTHITAVVRPEDVEITSPEKGIIRGHVISVIFKGMHYEITIESGRNEIVARSVHTATVGDVVGMYVDPDNIHIMIAEDHTNYFTVDINSEYRLEFNGKMLDTSVTKIIPGSRRQPDGTLVDGHGETIDPARTKITASIEPQDISMTDKVEEGLIEGYISNLIYKGDHYSYVIHTDLEQDLVVDDEYLWNMDDHVGLIMPVEKMSFKLNR